MADVVRIQDMIDDSSADAHSIIQAIDALPIGVDLFPLARTAVLDNRVDILTHLIDVRGVNPNTPNANGATLLQNAILQSKGNDAWNPLVLHIIERSSKETIDYAVRSDVHAPSNGMTAIMFAVMFPNSDVLTALCQKSSTSINLRMNGGLSALHLAADEQNIEEIIRILLQYGADPTLKSDTGETAYDYALSQRDEYGNPRMNPRVLAILRGSPDPEVRPGSPGSQRSGPNPGPVVAKSPGDPQGGRRTRRKRSKRRKTRARRSIKY